MQKRRKLKSYSVRTLFVHFLLPLGHRIRSAFSLKTIVWAAFCSGHFALAVFCFHRQVDRSFGFLPAPSVVCFFFDSSLVPVMLAVFLLHFFKRSILCAIFCFTFTKRNSFCFLIYYFVSMFHVMSNPGQSVLRFIDSSFQLRRPGGLREAIK